MRPHLGAQRSFFEAVAGSMRGPRAMLLRNLEWTGSVVTRMLARSPRTNALIRTTAAATVIRGGVKSNILPQEATAIINFRILPGDSASGVLDHVRSVVGDGIRVRAIDFGDVGSRTAVDDRVVRLPLDLADCDRGISGRHGRTVDPPRCHRLALLHSGRRWRLSVHALHCRDE